MNQKGSGIFIIIIGVALIVSILGGIYYFKIQGYALTKNEPSSTTTTINNETAIANTVSIPSTPPTSLKTYTSSTEKATFQYPADWTVTKPSIQSNYPSADQVGLKSPSGEIIVSWVSALNGFGGGCDQDCPRIIIVDKVMIPTAPGLFVVSGLITTDNTKYQPWMAVQDKDGLISSGPQMGYDMFQGFHNGSLPEANGNNTNVIFSTGDAYAKGPSLSLETAKAYFDKPEVKQAKQIMLSLTY